MKFFILSFLLVTATVAAQSYSKTLDIDLNRDGKTESLVLNAKHEPALAIYHGKTKIWSGIPRRWKPWKMTTGDVDGDGKREIILGVRKSTRFLRFEHNCLFVWGFDGKVATKKWLGSSLSKPFSDFLLSDIDNDGEDELIALEQKRGGKKCVVVYSWIGFGFGADWQTGDWKIAKLQRAEKNKIWLDADGKYIAVSKPKSGALE
jgi:hypothetical protein